jgi:hypothetical protein
MSTASPVSSRAQIDLTGELSSRAQIDLTGEFSMTNGESSNSWAAVSPSISAGASHFLKVGGRKKRMWW